MQCGRHLAWIGERSFADNLNHVGGPQSMRIRTASTGNGSPQYVHGEINGAAAADLRAVSDHLVPVVRISNSPPDHMCVPSASGRLLEGLITRVRLAVNREHCQGVFAGHLAKRCQRRAIKRSTHHVPSEVSKPSRDPSRLLASKGGWGLLKDRSVDLIKTRRNDVDTWESNLTYQLLAGLYRPLCTNGLLCRMGDFAVIRIPHRANVIADVVAGAMQITAQFARIGAQVTAMAARILSDREQIEFAQDAYEIHWAKVETRPEFLPAKLLEVRRAADAQPTLWHIFNRCQESAMTGGVLYHSRTQRLVRTRRIRNIREDVRINTALWQAAVRILES